MKYFLLLFLIPTICAASPNIYALHINGINTSITEAQDNLDHLNGLTETKTNLLKWKLLYNQTSDLWGDLADVFRQKAQEKSQITLDDYVMIYMKANDLHYESGSSDYEIIKAGIKDDFINDPQYSGKNLESIVSQLHTVIPDAKNSYIFFIPHSQGNLYANQLYNYLLASNEYTANQLKIFGIATPADEVAGSGDYISSSNDLIINGLRLIKNVLSANSNAEFTINDILGHNLIDVYLKDSTTKKVIKQRIIDGLDILARYLSIFSSTGYLRISNNKIINPQLEFLPSTIMRNNEVIYSGSELKESEGYYYYFSTQEPPLLLYPAKQGRYTMNVPITQEFKQSQAVDSSIAIPQGTIGKIWFFSCFNDYESPTIRKCNRNSIDNNFGGTLGITEFDYIQQDLSIMKIVAPDLFQYEGLITIEEFNLN